MEAEGFMSALLQDVRYALRMLRKSPGFTVVAVLTLALGIGANTAMFSVINGVLLNPLPFHEPDRLVALYSHYPPFDRASISYPNFLDWVRDNRTFSAMAAWQATDFNLTGMGEPERVPVERVSASFFSLLGVKPVIGTDFRPDQDQLGAAPVALISGGFWARKFASSPDVLGKTLTLDSTNYTVIGVIPASFHFWGWNFHRSDVYVPIGQNKDSIFRDRRVGMGMDAVGRLKPGVTFEQARADLDALGQHLAQEYPESNKDTGIAMLPLKESVVGDIQPYLLVLLASVGFVLLIACVNVANLMLARSTGRTREFAIRIALGAGRVRVLRQILTESVLLALAGGAMGLLIAAWGVQGALKFLPEALPRAEKIQLDARVLLFTFVVSALAGILFGLVPALKISRGDVQETLKEGNRGTSAAHHRAQRIFVVVEMALAIVLLAGAGLMTRSLTKLWNVAPGFDPHNALFFSASFPPIKSPDAVRAFWREMQSRLAALPGVEAASLTVASRPMRGDSELPLWLEGQPKPASQSEMKNSLFYLVQPDYLKVMHIPLERGRFLTDSDNEHAPLVTVIDDRFAKLYFPGQDPIGKRINFDIMNVTMEVVGVVGHVKQWGLDESAASPVLAQCYFPMAQIPVQLVPLLATNTGAIVRTKGSPLAAVGSIRQAMEQLNSQMVVYDTQSLDSIISESLAAQRFAMILLAIFAGLALVMSCVGIYGVISYLAGQRTHEIGIRMALGAERRDIFQMVLGQAAQMALLGVAIGLVGALVLTRLMEKMLFGISPHDPLTLAAVACLLTLVAVLASYLPARRAAKVEPMVALRYE
jgi:putative ABC transport system permease protein